MIQDSRRMHNVQDQLERLPNAKSDLSLEDGGKRESRSSYTSN